MAPLCMQAMLTEYAANPVANWKSKDSAIYLVLALTVRGKTGVCGVGWGGCGCGCECVSDTHMCA